MTTIKENAQTFVPRMTKNIAELPTISVEYQVQTKTSTNRDGEEFTYNYIEVNGEEFRLPDSVLKDLKAILEKKPTLKSFSVSKSGDGRNTKYTVIPLD